MRRLVIATVAVLLFPFLGTGPGWLDGLARNARATDSETSRLWGVGGERWDRRGRLPDFSYAGYHRGERPLPALRPDVSVRDFGAVGDGRTDDSAAFQRALREARGKVLAIPPGRYVITEILDMRGSGTVLQGAGPHRSIIYVPKPLGEIRPNMGKTTSGRPTSNYSWSGGIISIKGRWSTQTLAKVTAPARRGEQILAVDRLDRFHAGDMVRLTLRDDDQRTLTRHLYAGDPGDFRKLENVRATWIARVEQVDRKGRRLVLDRPLRTDVRLEWAPRLHPARSSTEEIGIEHVAFEFPATPYRGHFTEQGYNAIACIDIRNGWVRDVQIRNADSGIFIKGASNLTLQDIVWTSQRERNRLRNSTGHHGIMLAGTDLLLSDFDFRTSFIHDITMSRRSAGNVVRRGRGVDLAFDHHKYANHANLFTDIDAGVGTNIFHSGGGAQLGRHCGAWTTWWNIRTKRPIHWPAGWAPDRINIIGVRSDRRPISEVDGRWFEPIAPHRLRPADLYEAQLRRRLGDDD